MLRLSVKDLKKGMIVAQSIYNNHGGSYLVRGSAITPEYIRQLQKIGIPTVNVTSADPSFQLLPPEDVVQETTRIDAIQHVFEAFQSVEQEGRLDAEAMERVSDNILIDLIQREYTPGTATPALEVGGVTVGLAICFDVIYDDVIWSGARDGAEVYLFQTNNADFRDTEGLERDCRRSRRETAERQGVPGQPSEDHGCDLISRHMGQALRIATQARRRRQAR